MGGRDEGSKVIRRHLLIVLPEIERGEGEIEGGGDGIGAGGLGGVRVSVIVFGDICRKL